MLTREQPVEIQSWDWEVEAQSSWSKSAPVDPSDPSAGLLPMESLRPTESLRPEGYVFVHEGFDWV
jgi:hypothetical protein